MTQLPFSNRLDAGRRLAEAVAALMARQPEITEPVILALPRGGVPIAAEIARALHAPLDLLMVRKIGVPSQPELAAAAVVDGDSPQLVVNEGIAASVGMGRAALDAAMARELAVIERRRQSYLGARPPERVEGRDAIIVDDGIATGATTRAALRGVRMKRPRSVTLAVPVAPRSTLEALAREVDHVVCLATPEPFFAIGEHYLDFGQVPDAEVVRSLAAAGGG